jgi:hypothetical protein
MATHVNQFLEFNNSNRELHASGRRNSGESCTPSSINVNIGENDLKFGSSADWFPPAIGTSRRDEASASSALMLRFESLRRAAQDHRSCPCIVSRTQIWIAVLKILSCSIDINTHQRIRRSFPVAIRSGLLNTVGTLEGDLFNTHRWNHLNFTMQKVRGEEDNSRWRGGQGHPVAHAQRRPAGTAATGETITVWYHGRRTLLASLSRTPDRDVGGQDNLYAHMEIGSAARTLAS